MGGSVMTGSPPPAAVLSLATSWLSSRTRRDMVSTSRNASEGSSLILRRKFFRSTVNTRASPSARTVADRTSCSKTAISPISSSRPATLSRVSLPSFSRRISTWPSWITIHRVSDLALSDDDLSVVVQPSPAPLGSCSHSHLPPMPLRAGRRGEGPCQSQEKTRVKHSAEDVAVRRAPGEHVPQDAAQTALLTGSCCSASTARRTTCRNRRLRCTRLVRRNVMLAQHVVAGDGAADGPVVPPEGGFRDAVEDRRAGGGLRGPVGGADAVLVQPRDPAVADEHQTVGVRLAPRH